MSQETMQTAVPEVSETRRSERFGMLVAVEAQIDGQPALVRNLSAHGLGLRHAAQVRVGAMLSVKVDAPENDTAMHLRCRVAWSRLSRCRDERGRSFYDSGLFVLDDSPAAEGLLQRLIGAYGVRDTDSLETKRKMLEARARLREGAMQSCPAPAAGASGNGGPLTVFRAAAAIAGTGSHD